MSEQEKRGVFGENWGGFLRVDGVEEMNMIVGCIECNVTLVACGKRCAYHVTYPVLVLKRETV